MPEGPTPLERSIRSFLDHLVVERGVSANTSAAYRRDLARYAAFLADRGTTDLRAVATSDITAYATHLATGDGERRALAPASVARAVVAVRSLHRFAVEEGMTEDDLSAPVTPPQPGKRLPKALAIDQVQALLDAPDRSTPMGLRDATLLELLYGTGARISEVCVLDVDDVARLVDATDELHGDGTAGLRVVGKGDKERVVPLGGYAREALRGWLTRGRPALAERATASTPALLLNARGARLSRQSAWAILREQAERARLDVEISPHTLRHSFATHLLDGGADVRVVQELLGHASVTTTQIYTLVTVDHLRETYLTSHPRAY